MSWAGRLGHARPSLRRRDSEGVPDLTQAQVMRRDLQAALDGDKLVLHYQPKIELGTGRACCVEALVRWHHPERGLLPPSEFLPVAGQDSELIGSLTRWVLRRALADYAAWTAAGQDWTVAVNISAADLAAQEFPGTVSQILRTSGVRPERLHLEVNETSLALDTELARQIVATLAAQGVLISIDHFGTGHTGLSQLGTFPVSEVKIDRTFIAALPGDEHDRAIVLSLVDLGHSLGCLVTAEGVEWQGVADWLVGAGCDYAQGFLWLRPRAWTEVAQVFGATTATSALAAAQTRSTEHLPPSLGSILVDVEGLEPPTSRV